MKSEVAAHVAAADTAATRFTAERSKSDRQGFIRPAFLSIPRAVTWRFISDAHRNQFLCQRVHDAAIGDANERRDGQCEARD